MKKLGELFIDIVAKTTGLDRGLDQSAKKAEEAGRKIENSANQGARGIRNMDVQVSSLAQNLAGLARFPGAGLLGGIGGAAGGAALLGGASIAAGLANAQALSVEQNARQTKTVGIGRGLLSAIGSANRSALVPSQQRAAQASADRVAFLQQNAEEVEKLRQSSETFSGKIRQGTANTINGINSLLRYTDVTRLLPGPYSATSLIGDIADSIGLDDNISRAQDAANRDAKIFASGQRRLFESEERAVGVTSSPAFQAASQIDDIQTLTRYMQESVDLLRQIAGQNSLPGPGGAIGSGP